jgi:5'-deoxynucleotidase YfbR-like HD superfamily hydrolase
MTDYADREGNWITTFTGKRFYPLDPREEDIDIVDIAHSLSILNRFTGHTEFPFSVGQHSLHVSYALDTELNQSKQVQLAGLLHDASEAYVNDLATPLKRMLPEYCSAEKAILDCIDSKFNIATHDPVVKEADTRALVTEARRLCSGETWYKTSPWPAPYSYEIKEVPWREIKQEFLDRFQHLSA